MTDSKKLLIEMEKLLRAQAKLDNAVKAAHKPDVDDCEKILNDMLQNETKKDRAHKERSL